MPERRSIGEDNHNNSTGAFCYSEVITNNVIHIPAKTLRRYVDGGVVVASNQNLKWWSIDG
jgi:hypothetical protein